MPAGADATPASLPSSKSAAGSLSEHPFCFTVEVANRIVLRKPFRSLNNENGVVSAWMGSELNPDPRPVRYCKLEFPHPQGDSIILSVLILHCIRFQKLHFK